MSRETIRALYTAWIIVFVALLACGLVSLWFWAGALAWAAIGFAVGIVHDMRLPPRVPTAEDEAARWLS